MAWERGQTAATTAAGGVHDAISGQCSIQFIDQISLGMHIQMLGSATSEWCDDFEDYDDVNEDQKDDLKQGKHQLEQGER